MKTAGLFGVMEVDAKDYSILECNEQAQSILGYTRKQLLSLALTDIVDEIGKAVIRVLLKQFVSDAPLSLYPHNLEIHGPDDTRRLVSIQIDSRIPRITDRITIFVFSGLWDQERDQKLLHLATFPLYNPMPVIELDMTGHVIYTNPAAEKILALQGLDPSRVDLFVPANIVNIITRIIANDTPSYAEVRIGSLFFQEYLYHIPEFNAMRIYATDITNQKRTQQELTTSELRFRLALRSAPVSISAQDLDLRYIWAYNTMAAHPSSYIGKTDNDVMSKEYADIITAIKREVITSEKGTRKALWYDTGTRRMYVDLFIDPLRDTEGKVIGVSTAVMDITEMRLAQDALKRSRDYWERTFENVPELLAIVDQDYNIIQVNGAMSARLGLEPANCLGRNFHDLICATQKPYTQCRHYKSLMDEKPHVMEVHETRLDGDFLVSTTPLFDEEGKLSGSVHMMHDITHKKRTEMALRNLVHEKDMLLREVHHRVKNNLQIVYSLIRMQARRVKHEDTKQILIDEQNRIRSMALINEMFYNAENFAQIDIREYLQKLINHLRDVYKGQDHIVITESIDMVNLSSDAVMCCGLIVNELVSNALKYAFHKRDDGELRIILRSVDGYATLRVQDNGNGLPQDFDHQKQNSLGIEMVRALTTQLDGTMQMGSNDGTWVDIVFPIAKNASHTAES